MILNDIVCGEVLDVLSGMDNGVVDLTVTSPPYNKKITKAGKNSIMQPIKYDSISDSLPEGEYQDEQVRVMDEIYRVTKDGGSLFYNHKVRHLKGVVTHPMEWVLRTKWHLRQEIIWNRRAAVEVGGYRFYQVDERVYWLYKPEGGNVVGRKMLSKHARVSSVWEFAPDRRNSHPAPFPLDLPLRCILSVMDDERGVVMDPYMGSGTVGVACKLLGKEYIGIDISENYIKDAKDRINKFEGERYKLEKELLNHIVVKSYKDRQKERDSKKVSIDSFNIKGEFNPFNIGVENV
jgi:modification methylase